ncbi:hypothetical protein LCGC14_0195950 [marine sediment metagenome]|uniref:Uncharacterized protein n=1 Tax=marine sediment metagenome TaxID=412755 RepID=A0A0F9V246_9ZZZZ
MLIIKPLTLIKPNKKNWTLCYYKLKNGYIRMTNSDVYWSDGIGISTKDDIFTELPDFSFNDDLRHGCDNFVFFAALTMETTYTWIDTYGNKFSIMPSETKNILRFLLEGKLKLTFVGTRGYIEADWTLTKKNKELSIKPYFK